ncbi:hypothetical protein SHKM778_54470 [Streptomyces sp. KM77-8]|uniref:Alpha/beta hydrolase n=1 Tax=Streptomyces haneummycinicus TaxID=3074435 RepID=A0AAT9HP02_9ACTN
MPVTGTWARVPGIGVPVLTVNGALDAGDLIAGAERFAGAVREGRSVLVDGVAHYPNLERPEELNRILLDFLRDL